MCNNRLHTVKIAQHPNTFIMPYSDLFAVLVKHMCNLTSMIRLFRLCIAQILVFKWSCDPRWGIYLPCYPILTAKQCVKISKADITTPELLSAMKSLKFLTALPSVVNFVILPLFQGSKQRMHEHEHIFCMPVFSFIFSV